jgi:hypothetical protein
MPLNAPEELPPPPPPVPVQLERPQLNVDKPEINFDGFVGRPTSK